MELSKTYRRLLSTVVAAVATVALSGCFKENSEVVACKGNATNIETILSPSHPNYRQEYDPNILEPLYRDRAAEFSTILDDVYVGMGQLVCIHENKKVLTKAALNLAQSLERVD